MAPPNPIGPGSVLLGRYECLRVLGRGAMGEVLDVRDRRSGERYALKRVPPEIARQQAQMQAVRMNFKLVNGLTHPHIAVTRFLETDEETGEVFILMDLVRGRDLQTWVMEERQRRNDMQAPLPMGLVLGIAEQAALALDYAHFQPIYADDGTVSLHGVLHRDFKPSNVMVVDGREHRPGVPYVKVVDFGLAAEIQGSMLSQTQFVDHVNALAGTPLYMAPEQWLGRRLTRAIDQWALAVMIYEMAEGCPPFPGPTRPELRDQVLNQPPLTPEILSPEQWAVLAVSFDKDRARRRGSCLELVDALAAATPGALDFVGRPQGSEGGGGPKSGTSSSGDRPPPPSRPRGGEGPVPSGSAWNNDSSPHDRTIVPGSSAPPLEPSATGSVGTPAAAPQLAAQPAMKKLLASRDTGRLAVDQTVAPGTSEQESAEPPLVSAGRSSDARPSDARESNPRESVASRLGTSTGRRKGWSLAARWFTGTAATLLAAAATLASLGYLQPPPAVGPSTGPGTLVVEIEPADARLIVDDQPPRAMSGHQAAWELPPGKRRIRIEKEGFQPFTREAVVRSGERERWVVRLTAVHVAPSGGGSGHAASGTSPLALKPLPPQRTAAGRLLTFQAVLVDPAAAGPARFELVSPSPALAEIDPRSGVVRWTPSSESPAWNATFRIRVRASRPDVPPYETDVAVRVDAGPSSPSPPKPQPLKLATAPEQTLKAGETLRMQLAAVDPNPSPAAIRFELVPPSPAGALLDPAGLLTWTPQGAASIGLHALKVRAASSWEGTPPAEGSFAVRVVPPSRARLLVDVPGDQEVIAGDLLRTQVKARNPNDPAPPPRFRLTAAPPAAAIDAASGEFRWPADPASVGKRLPVQGIVEVADDFTPPRTFEFHVMVRSGPPRPLRSPFSAAEAAAAQAAWAQKAGRPEVVKNTIGMELVVLPPGEYLRGARDYGAEPDEQPPHRVRLAHPVWIGKYETTRGQYATFVREAKFVPKPGEGAHAWNETSGKYEEDTSFDWRNAGIHQTDEHPVVNVSWDDAAAFCAWLSKKEGVVYRLPTEAEWEYACRAGTTTIFHDGDDARKLYLAANVADLATKAKFPNLETTAPPDGYVGTAPVGKFKPNAFGLYDMHGNVFEWCSDWYGDKVYTALHDFGLPANDPAGPGSGQLKVIRGGAFYSAPKACRVTFRGNEPPDHRINALGFRVVLDPKFK